MTSEQLEVARAERMRQNGHGAVTLEDARTWIEETGLCLFLPRRQFSSSLAPSFVEAIAGQRNPTPDLQQIAGAEELLVRLELDGVAVRLNLLGQPGEHPDYVVAAWVLPYVYALRGDRDWRRSPQLTGSRQVSQLAIQAYKQLEQGDATISELKDVLAQGVSEVAVLRAITELWQQLRIIPVISAPGTAAKWQLLRQRFQKAIAEGASTSQVTAISVLASIFLQAVIAASMEEVEIFLSPLTARSKIREVLRGLVATRQVHTLSLGQAPHFYVAGTLPEFSITPTIYGSSIVASYLPRYHDQDDSIGEHEHVPAAANDLEPVEPPLETVAPARGNHRASGSGKPAVPRHFARPAASHRDRKPTPSGASNRPARRSTEARPANGQRSASGTRWAANSNATRPASASSSHGSSGNGSAARGGASHGTTARAAAARPGAARGSKPVLNGKAASGTHSSSASQGNGKAAHAKTGTSAGKPVVRGSSKGHSPARGTKPAAPARGAGTGRGTTSSRGAWPAAGAKTSGSNSRPATGARADSRTMRKPALASGYSKSGTKKRG